MCTPRWSRRFCSLRLQLRAVLHGGDSAVELGDSGMVWNCFFQVRDVEAQGLATHLVRRRILARFHRDGIALALPQRVLRRPRAM